MQRVLTYELLQRCLASSKNWHFGRKGETQWRSRSGRVSPEPREEKLQNQVTHRTGSVSHKMEQSPDSVHRLRNKPLTALSLLTSSPSKLLFLPLSFSLSRCNPLPPSLSVNSLCSKICPKKHHVLRLPLQVHHYW